jgi:basic membrane lipoprotein Med (substrate-binding protein (PBP1-ABC) superfamily)
MKYTRNKIPESVLAKIEEYKEKVINGEIVVPSTPERA